MVTPWALRQCCMEATGSHTSLVTLYLSMELSWVWPSYPPTAYRYESTHTTPTHTQGRNRERETLSTHLDRCVYTYTHTHTHSHLVHCVQWSWGRVGARCWNRGGTSLLCSSGSGRRTPPPHTETPRNLLPPPPDGLLTWGSQTPSGSPLGHTWQRARERERIYGCYCLKAVICNFLGVPTNFT